MTSSSKRTPLADATETRILLESKAAAGASVEWLHERTGLSPALIRGVLDGTFTVVTKDAAQRAFDTLPGVVPPKARAPRPARGIPSGPVREHLQRKVAEGATLQWLVAQSGVAEDTVQSVLAGDRPTVYAKTAARLLAVDGTPPPPKRPVDPTPTVMRVREMVSGGWPLRELARRAGLSERTVQESELASGVTAETAERIRRVHAQLQGRPGPALRPYPWLADAISGYPMTQVAAGAGVGYESVRRLVAGGNVGRDVARRVCAWMVLTRQAGKRFASEDTAGWRAQAA